MVRLDLELCQALSRDYFLFSIGHGKVIRRGLGGHSAGFEVGPKVVRVNKVTCGAGVYHSVCGEPSAAVPYFQFYDDVYERVMPTVLGVGDKSVLGCCRCGYRGDREQIGRASCRERV